MLHDALPRPAITDGGNDLLPELVGLRGGKRDRFEPFLRQNLSPHSGDSPGLPGSRTAVSSYSHQPSNSPKVKWLNKDHAAISLSSRTPGSSMPPWRCAEFPNIRRGVQDVRGDDEVVAIRGDRLRLERLRDVEEGRGQRGKLGLNCFSRTSEMLWRDRCSNILRPGTAAGAATDRRLPPVPARFPECEFCVRIGLHHLLDAGAQRRPSISLK